MSFHYSSETVSRDFSIKYTEPWMVQWKSQWPKQEKKKKSKYLNSRHSAITSCFLGGIFLLLLFFKQFCEASSPSSWGAKAQPLSSLSLVFSFSTGEPLTSLRHTEALRSQCSPSPGRDDLFPQGGECLPPPKLRGSLNLQERSRSHMITGTRGHLGGSW